MKIPVGKIAKWIGRSILAALVSEAADRLSRPKPINDHRQEREHHGEGNKPQMNPE